MYVFIPLFAAGRRAGAGALPGRTSQRGLRKNYVLSSGIVPGSAAY